MCSSIFIQEECELNWMEWYISGQKTQQVGKRALRQFTMYTDSAKRAYYNIGCAVALCDCHFVSCLFLFLYLRLSFHFSVYSVYSSVLFCYILDVFPSVQYLWVHSPLSPFSSHCTTNFYNNFFILISSFELNGIKCAHDNFLSLIWIFRIKTLKSARNSWWKPQNHQMHRISVG